MDNDEIWMLLSTGTRLLLLTCRGKRPSARLVPSLVTVPPPECGRICESVVSVRGIPKGVQRDLYSQNIVMYCTAKGQDSKCDKILHNGIFLTDIIGYDRLKLS